MLLFSVWWDPTGFFLFFLAGAVLFLHCHQQFRSKQITCTLLELGKDFRWWGRKDFAVNWVTCGIIPQGWGFPWKIRMVWVRMQQREGLNSSEGFFELGIVAVGCSACSAERFHWSEQHQGDYDAAKHQHFKRKPFLVRSQLLCPPSPSESFTFLLQRTELRSIAGNKSGGCSYSESSFLFGFNEILLKHYCTCCL